jgi:integrase
MSGEGESKGWKSVEVTVKTGIKRSREPKKGSQRGMGRIYRRSGKWWVDVQHGHIRIRRSTKTTDRQAAKAYLTDLLAEIKTGRFGTTINKVTPFTELVALLDADYTRRHLRSWKRALLSIAHLRKTFGSTPAAAITTKKVSAYITRRATEGAKAGTIHAEVAALRRMLRLAVGEGLVASVPQFPSLPSSPARQGFLTPAQVEAVISHLEQPVADLVQTLWITGWRKREVQFLKWSDLDMKAGTITLVADRSKTGEARLFPFKASASLAALLKARHAARAFGSVYVFERSPGQPVKDFRRAWEAACEKAGVPGRLVHDLRRSRARVLSRANVPQSVAMRLLGHKTASMFLRYDVAATEDLADAVAASEPGASGTTAVRSARGGAEADETEPE